MTTTANRSVAQDEQQCAEAPKSARSSPIFLMTESLQTGGTERQFSLAARALRADFDVRLGCVSRSGSFIDDVGEIGEYPTGTSMLGPLALRSTKALMRDLRAQHVMLAHAFDFYTNVMMVPAARAAGVPVVIGSQRQLGDLLSPAKRVAQSAAFHWCDAVVCNCRAAADLLKKHGLAEEKLAVIPNYVPAEAFAEIAPALTKKEGVLRIGMVARMNHAVKNHPLLLRAFAVVASETPVELILAGDGPLRPGLERLASELGIADKVMFLGDRRDIGAVLRSLDVAVLTSDSEALSNAILEGMAAGLPVVASRVGGNIELVEDGRTGLLFSVGNEGELVRALRSVLASSEIRHQMGSEARRRVLERYHMDVVLNQFRELYRSLLMKKGVQ